MGSAGPGAYPNSLILGLEAPSPCHFHAMMMMMIHALGGRRGSEHAPVRLAIARRVCVGRVFQDAAGRSRSSRHCCGTTSTCKEVKSRTVIPTYQREGEQERSEQKKG